MKRKVITIFMIACMILTYMPSMVFADGVVSNEDSASAESVVSAEEAPAKELSETPAATEKTDKVEKQETNETQQEIKNIVEKKSSTEVVQNNKVKDEVSEEVTAKKDDIQFQDLKTSEIDSSSKRLLVKEKEKNLKDEPVIATYDNIALIQYETEEEALKAYKELSKKNKSVEFDSAISIASSNEEDNNVTAEMTKKDNPFVEAENTDINKGKYDIAVIDTGANDADEIVSVVGDNGKDKNGHGQNMVDTIKEYAPKAKILSIKAIRDDGYGDASAVYSAINLAIEKKVKVINLSISASANDNNFVIEEIIKEAESKGITVVGAAGNNGTDASLTIPGKVKEATIVSTTGDIGNKGDTVDYEVTVEYTSTAAAVVSGLIASNTLDKYLNDSNIVNILPNKGLNSSNGQVSELSDNFSIAAGSNELTEGTKYNWYVDYDSGWGTQRFVIKNTNFEGVCCEHGESNLSPGQCKLKRVPNNTREAQVMYYMVYVDKKKGQLLKMVSQWANFDNATQHNLCEKDSDYNEAKKYYNSVPTNLVVPSSYYLYRTTWTHDDGLGRDGSQQFRVWYYVPAGDLKISKTIQNGDPNAVFTFTITLSEKINETHSGVTFTNGVGTIQLKGGQSKTIQDLPADATYTVVETPPNDWELVYSSGTTGRIPAGGTASATFKNRQNTYAYVKKVASRENFSHPENYSLAGAKYWIYDTQAHAQAALTASIAKQKDASVTIPQTGRLADADGNTLELVTKADGSTQLAKLKGDVTYYAVEVQASTNYFIDETVRVATVTDANTADNPAKFDSTEVPKSGWLQLIKRPAQTDIDYLNEAPNNYTLGGAEYDVFVASGPNAGKLAKDIDGNTFTLKTTYDSAKKLGVTNKVEVDVGDYYAKEKVAPKGYIITSPEQTFDSKVMVTEANDINNSAKFEVENQPTYKSPEIKLFKYDPKGVQGWEKLLGAYYQVSYYDITCPYGDADNPKPDSITYTKPTRKWIFKTREVSVDTSAQTGGTVKFAGWDWDTDSVVSSVTLDGPVTTASGQKYKAGDVIKSDPFYVEGGKRILPIGFYTIEEIKAPTGISRNPLVVHGKIYQSAMGQAALDVKDRKMIQVQYPEDEQDVSIAIQKKDKETGENKAQGQLSSERLKNPGSLKGAVYNVYFNNDETKVPEIVGTLTTDKNGYAELTKRTKGRKQALAKSEDLEPGNYYIEEVQASDGYVIDKYLLDGDATVEEVKHEIEVICDYDEDGNPVKKTIGGTYDVDDLEGNVDFTGDIDNEKAVKGNIGSRHVFHARVEARNTNLFKFTVESLESPHNTEIFKTDITTGELLEGATLQVLDSKGDVIEQWVSTKEPHMIKCLYDETQGELKDGKYTLREISAPYGYDIAEDVQFEVKSNQIYNKVEMKNKPISIGTIATDAETKSHQGTFNKEEKLIDKVKITGLYAGRTYKASGVLMDKATGKPLLDANGAEVTAESEPFVASGDEMEAEVVFTIDSSEFTTDKILVAFEKLYRVERFREEKSDFPGEEFPKELQKHEDLNDEDQSIHYGGIVSTHASDKASKSHNILAAKDVTIVDVVKYENLSPNEEYLLKGQLFDKTTGELLQVTAERPFTPETPDGEVEMEFTFDASGFENHDLVVFEELYINGVFINDHKNPDDEEQTMHVPEIKTTATDVETNDHIAYGSELVTVKDLVMYYNLIPGNEYTMKGTLMSKETGEPIQSDGQPVTAEAQFVPTEKDGSVELTFTFDGTELLGETVVAFEECDINDVAVAIHADLNDENQSVNIPEIGTKAALVKKTVEDTVEYKNLLPGKYVMRGWLVNHKNGKKLKDSDGEFEFEVTENHASGEVVVELPINGYNKLGGYSLTAFEELYYQKVITDEQGNETIEESLVAVHTDRNDKKQTVKIPNIKTGDTNSIYIYGGLFAILVIAGAVYVVRRRKNK